MNRSSLRAGKMLFNGYRLVRLRGQGSFGHVWETEGPYGEKVALKLLRCGSDLAAAQEVRNILNVKGLKHPHLVRVDRVWADRGYIGVLMELADGSLQDMLNICRNEYGTPMLPDYACYYLSQAADALDFLNANRHKIGAIVVGIQHGDVKPSNILLSGETVKLSDFGLSNTLSSSQASHRRAGTPAYAAPEIMAGQRTRWSDQFALAVTYCELRGGRRPFDSGPGRYGNEYVYPEPDLSMLPTDERGAVARALSFNPWERWKSCGEFMSQLNRIAGKKTA